MTNQQKFIETFGQEVFDTLMSNCDNIDILKWFMNEYQTECSYSEKTVKNVVEEQPVKKRGCRKGIRHYNTRWYESVVEDFYLCSDRTKDIRISDDKTACPAKSMDSLCNRLKSAIQTLGVEDCVTAHKYYRGTVNECVVLENFRNPKSFQGSYKLP